jgi:hypothetical protein
MALPSRARPRWMLPPGVECEPEKASGRRRGRPLGVRTAGWAVEGAQSSTTGGQRVFTWVRIWLSAARAFERMALDAAGTELS